MSKTSKIQYTECNALNSMHVEDIEDIKYMYCRYLRYLKCMYTDYSCELSDSTSESDEVHTLELALLMFITLSTT